VSVRVALVGTGAIVVRAHLPSLRAAGAEVVAFASRSPESATAAAAEWGSGEVYTDWRAAVHRDDVDAVIVSTPNALHAEMVVEAAGAGRHVLVEKPMATTVAEADAMIAAARSAGVVLMVAHNMRFAAPVAAMRASVVRGDIGEVVGFRAAFGHAGPLVWSSRSAWFLDAQRAGGGALLDLGVHLADTLRMLIADEPTQCTAMLRPSAHAGIEEAADVVLRFAGGCMGTLHASWITTAAPDLQITLLGTEATLDYQSGDDVPTLRLPAHAKGTAIRLSPATSDPTIEFVRSVAAGGPAVPPTAVDGRAALAVVEAAYRAANTGAIAAVAAPT
jgi:predicted dehydrogenase